MNQSHKPLSIPLGHFAFFWKFAKLFAAHGVPLVSLTSVAKKIFYRKSFNYFVWTLLGSRLAAGVVDIGGAP
jgi:hypothetical protein